ncbi:hypothetical protein OFT38_004837 [Salmonella enterica]|nr:hypothetical protein [Salmonella enterica]
MATPDNFARFLNESLANGKCLSCGSTDMYMRLADVLEVGPEPKTAEEIRLGPFIVLDYVGPFTGYTGCKGKDRGDVHDYEFRVTCSRCGFIHRYSAFAFMVWMDKQGGEK